MLKDILCVIQADEAPSAALSQALAFHAGYGVNPTFVAVAPSAPVVANVLGTDFVQGLISEANNKAAELATAIESKVLHAGKLQGFAPAIRKHTETLAEISAAVEKSARCHDLTIIDRADDLLDPASAVFEAVLFGSGRPALVATPAKNPVERIRTAVLAWDGSANAARSLSSAIGLFPSLETFYVFTVVGKDEADPVPGSEIAAHIRKHGVEVVVACADARAEDGHPGILIAEYASRKNVDLIVMGGYGHSRFREFILGGVTEYLSKTAPVPILFSH
jgi:nucleotide-binding universal stress UspA family protein